MEFFQRDVVSGFSGNKRDDGAENLITNTVIMYDELVSLKTVCTWIVNILGHELTALSKSTGSLMPLGI